MVPVAPARLSTGTCWPRLVASLAASSRVTMSLPPIAQRGISIRGSYVGSLRELHEVVALAKTGRLAPPPIEVRPAAEASRSMEELRDGRVSGRVVLDFGSIEA